MEQEKKNENMLNKKKERIEKNVKLEKMNPAILNNEKCDLKLKLQKQIEFYFSDANLLNDKFLRNLISKDNERGVDISIIENFNKIKILLSGIETKEKKEKYLKQAIKASKSIKFSNINPEKIIRNSSFNLNKAEKANDEKTVYVENLPADITHEQLVKIFSRVGNVLHASIPKFSDNKLAKGFAFIIFENKYEAQKSISALNCVIPSEIIRWDNKYEMRPLKIISKKEWLEKKEEFKKIKKELQNENIDLFSQCLALDNTKANLISKGTLIKLSNLPEDVEKNDVKIQIAHFIEPSYVDLNALKRECIVRFSHQILADSFLQKYTKEKLIIRETEVGVSKLEDGEEDEYINKVQNLKHNFSQKLKNKKNKKLN
jgi:RNA recognition motif-containing protein